MNVEQLLKTKGAEPIIIAPDTTIRAAARVLAERKKGIALVCGPNRKLLGVVSVIDINRAVAEHGERAPAMPVESIMTKDFCSCQLGESLEDVLMKMTERHIRHLPVVEQGALKGLLGMRGVLEARLEDTAIQSEEMQNYIFGVGYH